MSWQDDCLVRLSAAAQDTQLTLQHLRCVSALLQSVIDGLSSVTAVSLCFPPTDPSPVSSNEQKGLLGIPTDSTVCAHNIELVSSHAVGTACIPADPFWRVWRASSAVDALFHRSGMSTSIRTFESTVTARLVHSHIPRLLEMQARVQRVGGVVEREGRRVLTEHKVGATRSQWTSDAVAVLAQATGAALRQVDDDEAKAKRAPTIDQPDTHCAASTLWANLEADFAAVAAPRLVESNAFSNSEKGAIREGRLRQQQQRVLQLFREIVTTVGADALPVCSSTNSSSVKPESTA
ncbi:hypothetical protein ABB37_03970 [Leptomonas pyrrhocoris]|uniref:Uncharacterized protein n=1 Tax=Leptomonas pyrrhocoris TaxID=157538 RepID=A0A0M9G3X4_LEPPY|nr:hypothetical protein ABB37_03970 [Leptomonas pyrrhocoris]KPA81649.1 hypothetical protein ABB37_03970 [Leptomonas pyrrhocoris]|eukprot:XP_015660088.1 hypothetical protein ABB37_03970 [Leptomonas pyrrhocoris]